MQSGAVVPQRAVTVDGLLGAQQVLSPAAQQRVYSGHTGRQLPVHQRAQAAAYLQQMMGANVRVFLFLWNSNSITINARLSITLAEGKGSCSAAQGRSTVISLWRTRPKAKWWLPLSVCSRRLSMCGKAKCRRLQLLIVITNFYIAFV